MGSSRDSRQRQAGLQPTLLEKMGCQPWHSSGGNQTCSGRLSPSPARFVVLSRPGQPSFGIGFKKVGLICLKSPGSTGNSPLAPAPRRRRQIGWHFRTLHLCNFAWLDLPLIGPVSRCHSSAQTLAAIETIRGEWGEACHEVARPSCCSVFLPSRPEQIPRLEFLVARREAPAS